MRKKIEPFVEGVRYFKSIFKNLPSNVYLYSRIHDVIRLEQDFYKGMNFHAYRYPYVMYGVEGTERLASYVGSTIIDENLKITPLNAPLSTLTDSNNNSIYFDITFKKEAIFTKLNPGYTDWSDFNKDDNIGDRFLYYKKIPGDVERVYVNDVGAKASTIKTIFAKSEHGRMTQGYSHMVSNFYRLFTPIFFFKE